METFISKQPNGLYCKFSNVTNCPVEWNLSEEEYVGLCVKRAVEQTKRDSEFTLHNDVHDFEDVVTNFKDTNMSEKDFKKFLEETSTNRDIIKVIRNKEKINAINPEIVIHGTEEEPYYEIQWYDVDDNMFYVGYSSYNLSIVRDFLKERFNVVAKGVDMVPICNY